MRQIRWYGPTLVLLATVLMVMLAGPHIISQITYAQERARIELIKHQLDADPSLERLSESFRQIARFVEPSVVHIQVFSRTARPGVGGLDEDLLRRWFEGPRSPLDRDPPREEPRREREDLERYNAPRQYGNGSGWVYDDKGHIVTNNHVIDGADKIVVRFRNGAEREARVVGTDPKTDIAVLKIDERNLIPARRAAKSVEQGDIVFAFGSPLQFEFSMSQGIVSGKGRSLGILRGAEGYENFIQTDASINPGNSGGPLSNIKGEVVGMNTAIATRSGFGQGVGFAIPVDIVERVVEQLIDTGRVVRGYMGIYIEDLDQRMARTFGFEGFGVLVANPIPGSPAEKAGLKRGDIITRIDDRQVRTADEMRSRISLLPPGTKIEVEVFRSGESVTIPVTIGELPENLAALPRTRDTDLTAEAVQDTLLRKLGLEEVQTALRDESKPEEAFKPGVLVRRVRPGSSADAAGIRAGMIITEVMGKAVDSVPALVRELGNHDLQRGVRLSIMDRTGTERFVVVDLPQ